MENRKLISMVNYISQTLTTGCLVTQMQKLHYYKDFLSQKPEIWQFIPCKLVGDKWVSLEEPYYYQNFISEPKDGEVLIIRDYPKCEEYQEAKDRCYFDGFDIEYFNYGGDVSNKSSFQIISKCKNVQICVYKSQPNYFIWNYKTIEDLTKCNLSLTQQCAEKLNL